MQIYMMFHLLIANSKLLLELLLRMQNITLKKMKRDIIISPVLNQFFLLKGKSLG